MFFLIIFLSSLTFIICYNISATSRPHPLPLPDNPSKFDFDPRTEILGQLFLLYFTGGFSIIVFIEWRIVPC